MTAAHTPTDRKAEADYILDSGNAFQGVLGLLIERDQLRQQVAALEAQTLQADRNAVVCMQEAQRQRALCAELVGALSGVMAAQYPFMSKELGGGGLDYTSENLLTTAWDARNKASWDCARAILAKHAGGAK